MELAKANRYYVPAGLLGSHRVGLRSVVRPMEGTAEQLPSGRFRHDPDRVYAWSFGVADPVGRSTTAAVGARSRFAPEARPRRLINYLAAGRSAPDIRR